MDCPDAGKIGTGLPLDRPSVLFTQTVPITATGGAWLEFIDPALSVLLPDFIGVGLMFGGVDFDPTGAGSDATPLSYDPPTTGQSFDDYWLRGYPNPGDPWALYTFGGNPPINFRITIETVNSKVPEPSSSLSLVLGALASIVTSRFAPGTPIQAHDVIENSC